jgi:hypothetical protein
VAIEIEDLRSRWPAQLFVAEGREMRRLGYRDEHDLGWLVDEAFADGLGYQLFRDVDSFSYRGHWRPPQQPAIATFDPWSETETSGRRPTRAPTGERASVQLFDHLLAIAPEIPAPIRRRYYLERRRPANEPHRLTRSLLAEQVAACLQELNEFGYFEQSFGSTCPDADSDPNDNGDAMLRERVFGQTRHDGADITLWPPSVPNVAAWDEEVTLSVIEALYDLVARPRTRYWHDFHSGWDYSDYSRSSGREVFLWRINELLDRSHLGLGLAPSGEDRGLVVQTLPDQRQELLERALALDAERATKERVDHAVATFRRRGGSTRADKRAAVLSLHHILERHRDSLKAHLLRRDEAALFEIANNFDMRHHKLDQRDEYGDEFLDWVFWWYLATVELIQRLGSRGSVGGEGN